MQKARENLYIFIKVGAAGALCFCLIAASTRDGIYTAQQADRGQASYGKMCASCHGDKLDGGGQTPALSGSDFTSNWTGQTLDDLFEQIQTSMPADRPGTLIRKENADILAFLLSVNKFPAGKTELPNDADSLKQIKFDAP